jgi:ATP-dependent helicase/nuclease subunit B
MAIERCFLGWDEPVVTKVRRFLLGDDAPDPNALDGILLVVPTQQSGRRLRQSLTAHCARHDVHLGYIRPRLPIDLVRSSTNEAQVASPLECTALWAHLLLEVDYSRLTSLFPARDGDHGFAWSLRTGKLVQDLRYQLAAAGITVAQVATDFHSVLDEPERWDELAWLEERYLKLVHDMSRVDPGELRIENALRPQAPDGATRIILACAPDPEPIALHALGHLARDHTVQVLVHAPESFADRFDEWGRPLHPMWREAVMDIPDAEKNLRLAGSPSEQSRLAVSIIAEETFGPEDIGLGVPDRDVLPFLSADLQATGLSAFDPNGSTLSSHHLFLLLERYRALVDEGSYAAVASFLRHPDVLDHLHKDRGISTRLLLTELDEFHNHCLPLDTGDVLTRLGVDGRSKLPADAPFPTLTHAIDYLRQEVLPTDSSATVGDMLSFLQGIFSHRRLSADDAADVDFATVAQTVVELLTGYEESCVAGLKLAAGHIRTLLVEQLGSARYDAAHTGATIDLEGWLELHWNDAPFLIVTGMNDGKVPESITSDPFLPDSLRQQLGLRHDADRLARDTYLMQALIESRRTDGRACFILGKTGSSGDPLKPSRLLFSCSDAALPKRAAMLFGTPEGRAVNHAATTSFLLQPSPPEDIASEHHDITSMGVTAFKDYLDCPFRFYLKRVLRMETLDDRKTEMDPLDFGLLIHHVLSEMGEREDLRTTSDVRVLTQFLHERAERWATTRFGPSLPLNLQMQLDAAQERLSAVARAQAAEAANGWDIVLVEHDIEAVIEGVRVHGRIDRVDRHRESGQIRILDYKTSDTAGYPEKEHLKNTSADMADYALVNVNDRARRWVDLQLPLYAMMLQKDDARLAGASPGYFNIPGTIDNTGIELWPGFTDEIMESATICAHGIARDIRSRKFWPPAAHVSNDDFETLFHVEPQECIDTNSFNSYMEGGA